MAGSRFTNAALRSAKNATLTAIPIATALYTARGGTLSSDLPKLTEILPIREHEEWITRLIEGIATVKSEAVTEPFSNMTMVETDSSESIAPTLEQWGDLLSSAIPARARIIGKLAAELLSTMAALSLVENVLTYVKTNLQLNNPSQRPTADKILQELYQQLTVANLKKLEGPFAGLDSGFLGNLLRLYRPFLKPLIISYLGHTALPKDSSYFDIVFLILYTIVDTAAVAPLSVARTLQQTEMRAKLLTISKLLEADLLHNPLHLTAEQIFKELLAVQKHAKNPHLNLLEALQKSGFLSSPPAGKIDSLQQSVQGLSTLQTFKTAGLAKLFTRYDLAFGRQLSFNFFMLNTDLLGKIYFNRRELSPGQRFATSFLNSSFNTPLTQIVDCAYTRATKTGATPEEIKYALRKALYEAFCTGKSGLINMFGLACGVRIILLLPAMVAFNYANGRTLAAKTQLAACEL